MDDDTHTRPPRPGELTDGWRTALLSGWVAVMVGFGSVWQACRVAGIAPWWLGPETDMRSVFVVVLPFAPAIVAAVAAFVGYRYASFIGIAAGLAASAIALGDRAEFPGLALVELVIGVAGLLISIASLAGRTGPAIQTAPDPQPNIDPALDQAASS